MKREANSPRRLRTLGWSGTLESCSGGAACVKRGGLLPVGMCVMPGSPSSDLNPLRTVCTSPECVPRGRQDVHTCFHGPTASALSLAGQREHTPNLFAHTHLVYASIRAV